MDSSSDPPFDPYHIWLGISPADQPPNYYRLLGVDPFESNPDVIENAADRQMSHVRAAAVGRYSEESQQVLNEISQARGVLLDPSRKDDYDKFLKSRSPPTPQRSPLAPPTAPETTHLDTPPLVAAPSIPPTTPPISPPKRPAPSTAQTIASNQHSAPLEKPGKEFDAAHSPSRAKEVANYVLRKMALVLGGGATGIVCAVLLFWSLQRGSEQDNSVEPRAVAKSSSGGSTQPEPNAVVTDHPNSPTELVNTRPNKPAGSDNEKGSNVNSQVVDLGSPALNTLYRRTASAVFLVEAQNAGGVVRSSGFLIDPRGWIVADYKSVRSANHINVRCRGDAARSELQQRRIIKFVALNKKKDLAVLALDVSPPLTASPLNLHAASSSDANGTQGEYVMAGFNSEGELIFEPCEVNHVSKSFIRHFGEVTKSLEGGPLFGPDGGVVGIHWNEAEPNLSARTTESLIALLDVLDKTQADIRELRRTVNESSEASRREVALKELAGHGPVAHSALPEAVAALDGNSDEVRRQAIETIGQIGAFGDQGSTAVARLARLVETEGSSDIGLAGVAALVNIGPTSAELQGILREWLLGGADTKAAPNDPSKVQEDRQRACDHLVQLGRYGRWSLPVLRELLLMSAKDLDASQHLALFEDANAAIGAIGFAEQGLAELLQQYQAGQGLQSSNPNHLDRAKAAAGKAARLLQSAEQ